MRQEPDEIPVDPDWPDWAEIVQLMRDARAAERGYANYWHWPLDRRVAEREVVRVLREYLVQSGERVDGQISSVSPDPPDALLKTKSWRCLGIEVTELVDPTVVARHRYRKQHHLPVAYDWAEWSREAAADALSRLVAIKDRKLAKATANYDELMLAIFTDEPVFDENFARAVVATARCTSKIIGRAFLLVSYQPGTDQRIYPDGCPVLPIELLK